MSEGFRDYVPWRLKNVISAILNNRFGNLTEMHGMLKSLVDGGDQYCLCWDFDSYADCQGRVDACYKNQKEWVKKSIISVAHSNKFSTDRTINEYSTIVWYTCLVI